MNCDVPSLWQDHKEALYYFILKRVKDESTAKDLLHDVLLKVYDFCLAKSGVRNIRSWLFQIANNAVIDYYRKNSRSTSTDTFTEEFELKDNTAFEDAVEYILPMVNLLPSTYALPLKLSDVEGKKHKEIAQELGLELSAVKQRVSRARKMLKDIFTECCLMELDEAGRLVSFEIRPDCKALQRYKASLQTT